MKKNLLTILIISIVTLLIGCNDLQNPNNPNPDTENEKSEIEKYYPIKEDTRYIYEGKGNEFASYDSYVSYTDENKVQKRISNGGTVVIEVIEVIDGSVIKLLSRPEVYYRENLLRESVLESRDRDKEEILIKEPIKEGNSWDLNDGRKRSITDTNIDLTIEGKDYKAIEITTEGPSESTSKDYYVKDIGLVKSVFISEGMEVSSTLNKIQEDAVFTQNIRFFYPNIEDGKLYYKEKDIDFKTNDITRKLLEENYKQALSETQAIVLTENTKINYLYLNENGMAYIDLSDDFLKEMNAGSGYEAMILDSIATTFGNYYGVDKVVLTIDGENYESGHILLEKGDYLRVNKDALLIE